MGEKERCAKLLFFIIKHLLTLRTPPPTTNKIKRTHTCILSLLLHQLFVSHLLLCWWPFVVPGAHPWSAMCNQEWAAAFYVTRISTARCVEEVIDDVEVQWDARSVFSITGCLLVGCCNGRCRSLALSDNDAKMRWRCNMHCLGCVVLPFVVPTHHPVICGWHVWVIFIETKRNENRYVTIFLILFCLPMSFHYF